MEAKTCEIYRDAATSDEACGEVAAWRMTIAAPVGDGSHANHYYVYVCAEHVAQYRKRNADRIVEEQALVHGMTMKAITKLAKENAQGLAQVDGRIVGSRGSVLARASAV